jgi:cysteinyl-tRNA synthetase
VLGLAQVDAAQWAKMGFIAMEAHAHGVSGAEGSMTTGLTDIAIDERISARIAARKAKNWAESDRIRDELANAGVILEDKPGGTTTWRRA